MANRFHPTVVAAVLCALLGPGCGGSSSSGIRKTPKLPPVNTEALREFDAGMRAISLRGPEARGRAKKRLTAATKLDGNLWEAWHNLGVLYFDERDDEAAAEAFSKALRVNPAHVPSLLGRAEAARRQGDAGDAEDDYRDVIKARPTDLQAYTRLTSLLRSEKKFDGALKVVREALRENQANSKIYVELALVYLAQGRDELAELVLTKAIKLNDKDPAIYNAIALVMLQRGKDQEAFARFDYATSLDPTYVDARFNAASVLLDSGDYLRASQELQQVLEQRPSDYEAMVALGVAYRGIKNYDKAEATWERVVKGAPSRSTVRGDALWNLAVLEADIKMDDKKGIAALDRYLQESWRKHPKRKKAEERRKELGE